jgi:DNA-binding CsgD family transcriptional regulator
MDFAGAIEWGDALTSALCSLADAPAGAILLPDRSPRWRSITVVESGQHGGAWGVHEEVTERLHASDSGDLVYWVRDDLAAGDAPSVLGTTAGTIGIRVRTQSGAVAAVCVHRDRALGPAPVRLVASLRAIAPAFRAGVATWVASVASRTNVTRMLDSLADPAFLFSLTGDLAHANRAAERLVMVGDAARLRGEAQQIAWSVGSTVRRRVHPSDPSVARSLRIGATIYRLRGSLVGEQLVGSEPAVLVTMTASAAEPLSDDALHAAYGLTAREIQVARLIAEGLSNNEIADRLGVRFFTARNHVERTLAKLRVASRHRVGPLLRNESPSDLRTGRGGRASAA